MRSGINNSSFPFFFYLAMGVLLPFAARPTSTEKNGFLAGTLSFKLTGIAPAMCRLSIRAARSSSNQESRSGCTSWILSALRSPYSSRRKGRSSGEKTPLTKVNSHDQSVFAGAKSTDKKFYPRTSTPNYNHIEISTVWIPLFWQNVCF